MIRTWAFVLLAFLTACAGDAPEKPAEAKSPIPGVNQECPELPAEWTRAEDSKVWPSREADGLVPDFPDVCATPTAPALIYLLFENAGYAAEIEAVALGILHREDQPLATFTIVRVTAGTPGLDDLAQNEGGTTTEAAGRTLAWAGSGSHVVVYWVEGNDVVSLSAADEGLAAEAASTWLAALGEDVRVSPPEDIPEATEMPPALDAGPPVDDLPAGYTALPMDPFAFTGSDFADSVTISEEKGIEAMGAAVVVAKDGTNVGTLVAAISTPKELAEWPERLEGEAGSELDYEVVADGFAGGGLDVLVVGHERSVVENFTRAWESASES